MCTLSFFLPNLFPFTSCMPVTCSAALEHWHGLWRCRLSLQVTSENPISLQDSLTDPTFCSNALKCIYIVAARCCLFLCSFSLPFFILSHLSSLMHFFFVFFLLSLLTFSLTPYLSFYPFIIFFNSPIHPLFSFFFCLWAENWPKWMRSWRAVNNVIIWLLLAPLKAKDALSMATLYFVISEENWEINLLEVRTSW